MDRFDTGFARDLEDPVLVEIALCRHRRPKGVRLVRGVDMRGPSVGIGVDGYGRDAHLPQGPCDAHSDLPPVRDQDFSE
jgi:hypothetical protein